MTSDKGIENNLNLLDSILKYLIQDTPNYITNLEKLYEKVFRHPLAKDGSDGHVNFVIIHGKDFNFNDFNFTSDNLKAEYLKFNFACNYLLSENLVSIDEKNQIVITYKGIIQYSKGFISTYNEERSDKTRLLNVENFQRKTTCWMLWVNGAIALGTIVAMIYYLLEIFSVHVCLCK